MRGGMRFVMAAKCLRKLVDIDGRLQLLERALDAERVPFTVHENYEGGVRYLVKNTDYPRAAAIVRQLDPAQYNYRREMQAAAG